MKRYYHNYQTKNAILIIVTMILNQNKKNWFKKQVNVLIVVKIVLYTKMNIMVNAMRNVLMEKSIQIIFKISVNAN